MFLVVLSCGFAVAHLYLDHTTEMADGKPGLTMDDITAQFHGDRTKTTLKKQVLGGMKKFFQEERDASKLTPEKIPSQFRRLPALNPASKNSQTKPNFGHQDGRVAVTAPDIGHTHRRGRQCAVEVGQRGNPARRQI